MRVVNDASGPDSSPRTTEVTSSTSYFPNTRRLMVNTSVTFPPRYPMASTMWTPSGVIPPAGSCSGCWRHSGTVGLKATGTEMWVSMYWRSPTLPSWTISASLRFAVWRRLLCPTWRTTPAASAAAAHARASVPVRARGFSTKTCFPAAAAASTISSRTWCGVATSTPSTSGSAQISSRSEAERHPCFSANCSRLSGLRE